MIIPITQNMDCNAICKTIQKIIDRYNREIEKTNIGNHALSINITRLVDGGENHILKLEKKE